MSKARDIAAGRLSAASINGGQLSGLKNKIINGLLLINQGGVTSTTSSAATFLADMFQGVANVAGITTSVGLGGTPNSSQQGGSNIYLANGTSVKASLAAGDYLDWFYVMEGLTAADLLWGTANAKPLTISLRGFASQATTVAIAVRNYAGTRSYVSLVNVTAGVTPYSITIPGDTTGSWPTNNAGCIVISCAAAVGSTYTAGSAGSWLAGNFVGAPGMSNICDTANRYVQLSDIQAEVGDKATAFEVRPQTLEESLCYRYFFDLGLYGAMWCGYIPATSNTYYVNYRLPVKMRATPTASGVTAYSNPGFGTPTCTPLDSTVVQFGATSTSASNSTYFYATAKVSARM